MSTLAIRAVGFAAALAIGAGAAVAVAAAPASAVSGGAAMTGTEFAFLAKIRFGERAGCTAALVDPQWLITARSCVAPDGRVSAGAPAEPAAATVGSTDLATGGQARTVLEVVPHPDRNVVLARLSAAVTGVSPVPLATVAPAAGDVLRVAGFGRTGTGWAPDRAQGAAFTVRSAAGGTVELGGGAASLCQGDAGAPMLRAATGGPALAAVAATSSQAGCLDSAGGGDTAGATRVDDLGAWVRDATTRPYAIRNVATGKCVDVPNYGSGAIGQPLYQYTCDNTPSDNQLWFFDARGRTAAGEVLYSVRNAKDNLCVDPPGYDSVAPGTRMAEYYCGGAEDNQFFRMAPRGAGFWLVNDKSGLCLDVVGSATGGNDAPLDVFACADGDDHVWRLDRANWTAPPTFQSYAIANLVTAKCVDVPGYGPGPEGGQLYEYDCDTTAADNQLWFLDVRDLTADGQVRYALRNAKDGLCMDARPSSGGTVGPGSAVVANRCAGPAGHQYFRVVPRGPGIWLVDDRSGLCLDVVGVRTGGNDTPLSLYPCSEADDHIWALRAGAVTVAPGPAGPEPAPVAAPVPAGSAVEGFAYPGAAAILRDHGVTLLTGDGHVLFADCATAPVNGVGVLKVWTTESVGPGGQGLVCFRITGASGWLDLRVPAVYEIRGDGQRSGTGHAVTAHLITEDGDRTSVAVDPSGSTQVGVGASPANEPTTLLRLTVTG